LKVNLLTDAKRHNLALMKLSAFWKQQGAEVKLNEALEPCGVSYGSWLWGQLYPTDFAGGPGCDPGKRLASVVGGDGIDDIMPDYNLYPNLDYSVGITWEWCPRACPFCRVPAQDPPRVHRSISVFHNPRFQKICLLNNNTFSDPDWRQTFEEIWEADLEVVDQNGYDLRLIDEEKALALKRTRFYDRLYFAWDRMEDEVDIRRGLGIIREVRPSPKMRVYVLVGYPAGRPIDETDIYRCQVIADHGIDPFVMIYNNSNDPGLRWFRWMAHRSFSWRKLGFSRAWAEGYRPEKRFRRKPTKGGNS